MKRSRIINDGKEVIVKENKVVMMGLNLCGCDPGSACSLVAFPTVEEAYNHAKEKHMVDDVCPWWGCKYKPSKTSTPVDAHYASTHLLAKWKCCECGEVFSKPAYAAGCKHLQRNVEIVSATSRCGIEGCRMGMFLEGEMEPLELREHCLSHLDRTGKPPYKCHWKGCKAQLSTLGGLIKHITNIHLCVLYRCKLCGKEHKIAEQAVRCCDKAQTQAEVFLVLFSLFLGVALRRLSFRCILEIM